MPVDPMTCRNVRRSRANWRPWSVNSTSVAEKLRKTASEGEKKVIAAELQELKARQTLGKHQDAVLEEIERKKKK